jgi:Fur family iron response transcriptional regulator
MTMRRQSKQLSRSDRSGASNSALANLLRDAGLRPTFQRLTLGAILFANRDRHVTAEMLYQEAIQAKVPVSLATVYNTLNKFAEAGLLRQVLVGGSTTHFDTNTSHHPHFFVENANLLLDVPGAEIVLDKIPPAPAGYEFVGTEIVVRLKRRDG